MGTLEYNIAQLSTQNGALPKPIRLAAEEVLRAAEAAGHHITAVSWYNPASTPEHHVPGFWGNGGVAVDFMTYTDTKLQDWIDAYVWQNRTRLGVCWLISRRRIRSTSPGKSGSWSTYSGADPHTNHSHVNFGRLAGTNGPSSVTRVAYVPKTLPAPFDLSAWDGASFPGAAAFVVGQSNAAVTLLGQRLVAHGWGGYIDGPGPEFSETDMAAVQWFQRLQGWTGDDADGIPGPTTWALLMSEPSKPTEPAEIPGVNFRAATWNTRRSSYVGDDGTDREWKTSRKAKAAEFLADINGGVPGILLTQETTKEQQVDLEKITGYVGVGNGRGGHPKDRASDNVAVFVDTTSYRILGVKSLSSGGSAPRFLTLVQVERNEERFWVGSGHLTAHAENAALRSTEMGKLLNLAKLEGVDLARIILGFDLNETTKAGARAVAREFGLVDFIDLLSDVQFPNKGWSSFTGWDPDIEQGGRIDAILIGAEVQPRAGRIAAVGNGASDHNMIISNLTVKESQP